MTGATWASARSRPSGVPSSACSSARSTSNRATGTAEPSRSRIASTPSCCTTSAGSFPAGSRTTRASSPLPRSSSASDFATASWPAASGSWQSSTEGASRRSACTWSSVSAVPIEHTVSATPAWRSAITSV